MYRCRWGERRVVPAGLPLFPLSTPDKGHSLSSIHPGADEHKGFGALTIGTLSLGLFIWIYVYVRHSVADMANEN